MKVNSPDLFSAAAILSPLTSSVCAFRSILSDARREITPPVPLRWFTLVFTLTWAAAMPGEQGKSVEDALILSQIVLHDLYAAAFAMGAP